MNRALSPKAAHLMQAMETAAAPIALRFGQDVPVFSDEVAWDSRSPALDALKLEETMTSADTLNSLHQMELERASRHLEANTAAGSAARGLDMIARFREWYISEVERSGLEAARGASLILLSNMISVPSTSDVVDSTKLVETPKLKMLLTTTAYLQALSQLVLETIKRKPAFIKETEARQ